jgi:hypothetical protein
MPELHAQWSIENSPPQRLLQVTGTGSTLVRPGSGVSLLLVQLFQAAIAQRPPGDPQLQGQWLQGHRAACNHQTASHTTALWMETPQSQKMKPQVSEHSLHNPLTTGLLRTPSTDEHAPNRNEKLKSSTPISKVALMASRNACRQCAPRAAQSPAEQSGQGQIHSCSIHHLESPQLLNQRCWTMRAQRCRACKASPHSSQSTSVL